MRLFVGIALNSEATTATLERVRERLSGLNLRWSRAENRHVTLQFLGQASEEQLACVTAQMKKVQCRAVLVRIDGLGFFARAGIFHAGVRLTPQLLALQQSVLAATRPCGFEPELREYHPHITLARCKGRDAGKAFAALRSAMKQNRPVVTAEFLAEEFQLFESLPEPEGSRYEVLARFPLQEP
ncbi:MAG TPA: RNA 2',3'-cyclic phosphodiesterase [Acidobacteriaceae bacterium]|nr:RNA 2',3'-cyclic phosphodiesterase [Acidobacteriaceae bacterium]